MGLLGFAGNVAIGAIFSLVVTGQYIAYSIPISARYLGGKKIKPGPFSLGKLVSAPTCIRLCVRSQLSLKSLPVAVVAVVWMIFMVVVFLFPTAPSTTAQDMNYTVVVLGKLAFLSSLQPCSESLQVELSSLRRFTSISLCMEVSIGSRDQCPRSTSTIYVPDLNLSTRRRRRIRVTRKVKGWRKDILTYFLFCNKNDKLFQVYKNLSSVFWSFVSFMITTNVGQKPFPLVTTILLDFAKHLTLQ